MENLTKKRRIEEKKDSGAGLIGVQTSEERQQNYLDLAQGLTALFKVLAEQGFQADVHLQNLADFIDEFNKKMKDMSEEERYNFFMEKFGPKGQLNE